MIEELPPRVMRLKNFVARTIPCPDDDTKKELAELHLNELMIRYMTWVDRLIPLRPRKVEFTKAFWSRQFSSEQLAAVRQIQRASEAGDSLMPFLSRSVLTHGYTERRKEGKRGIAWADGKRGYKDLALNAFDAHHLHLTAMNADGSRSGGSRDLLFVKVSRTILRMLLLGDHNSFNDGSLLRVVAEDNYGTGTMRLGLPAGEGFPLPERQRLARAGLSVPENVNGETVMTGMMASDGSSTFHVFHCSRVLSAMRDWDRSLDSIEGRITLSEKLGVDISGWHAADWWLWYGDLCLRNNGEGRAIAVVEWRR